MMSDKERKRRMYHHEKLEQHRPGVTMESQVSKSEHHPGRDGPHFSTTASKVRDRVERNARYRDVGRKY